MLNECYLKDTLLNEASRITVLLSGVRSNFEGKGRNRSFHINLAQGLYIFPGESPETPLITPYVLDHRTYLNTLFQLCDYHMISLYSGDTGFLLTSLFLPPKQGELTLWSGCESISLVGQPKHLSKQRD